MVAFAGHWATQTRWKVSHTPHREWCPRSPLDLWAEPYAARTLLGWTLIGPIGEAGGPVRFSVNFISGDQEAISAQLKHMYEADFVESTPHRPAMSVEDHQALAIMESSVSKIDGHYQLALPWRFESPCLPNNKAIAEKRLGLLRRRFERNEHLFEKDCDALRFLWWPDGDLSKDPVEHQMLVHLFGATSSPSCASFALKKTANDNKNGFDVQTIDTVNRNFYVDDCLKSVPVAEEAIKLVDQLPRLLARGGFHLKKWVCNRREVLDKIPSQERYPSVMDLDFGDQQKDRALGIEWNILNDSLGFRIAKRPTPDTRRGILSLVSAMYDPLGLTSPLILPAKKVLQSLCKQEFGWDENIPDKQLTRWWEWVKDLPNIKGVTLPWSVKPEGFGELHSSQIHHFSDASEEGYGTVSYLRLVDVTGNIRCSILFGKSRVAPLKPVTIPWMELTAATLAAKLDTLLRRELSIPIHETVFWTDSTLVLQ